MSERMYLYEFVYCHRTNKEYDNLKSTIWAYDDESAYKSVYLFVNSLNDEWQVLEVKRVEGMEK